MPKCLGAELSCGRSVRLPYLKCVSLIASNAWDLIDSYLTGLRMILSQVLYALSFSEFVYYSRHVSRSVIICFPLLVYYIDLGCAAGFYFNRGENPPLPFSFLSFSTSSPFPSSPIPNSLPFPPASPFLSLPSPFSFFPFSLFPSPLPLPFPGATHP